jgi:hypothetical protein
MIILKKYIRKSPEEAFLYHLGIYMDRKQIVFKRGERIPLRIQISNVFL